MPDQDSFTDPPDDEKNQISARQAEALAAELLLGVPESGDLEVATPSPHPFFLADVEADVDRFKVQVEAFNYIGDPFPCVRFGQSTPIPIDVLGPLSWGYYKQRPYYYLYEWWRHFEFDLRERDVYSEKESVEFVRVHPEEAKGYFKRRLTEFLTARFRVLGTPPQPASPDHSVLLDPNFDGLPYTVRTTTPNLRVHYSPAYFQNHALVFGSKTPVVRGRIRPGRYVFGVAGVGISGIKISPSEFDVPETQEADLSEL